MLFMTSEGHPPLAVKTFEPSPVTPAQTHPMMHEAICHLLPLDVHGLHNTKSTTRLSPSPWPTSSPFLISPTQDRHTSSRTAILPGFHAAVGDWSYRIHRQPSVRLPGDRHSDARRECGVTRVLPRHARYNVLHLGHVHFLSALGAAPVRCLSPLRTARQRQLRLGFPPKCCILSSPFTP